MADYKNINLEKGMYYTPGKSFTQVLEELDPSANYVGTELQGLDAYQRQLKRFDIKVSGKYSDNVEKFFMNSQSAALFPEYMARAVKQGMDMNNKLPDMVATITKIDSLDYRTITPSTTASDFAATETAETEAIPETTIKTSDELVALKKRGRMLIASYEAIKFRKLDLFTVTLRQIGNYIAQAQMKDAVDVIINGDGNNNALVSTELEADLAYTDLVKLWGDLAPYNFNTIIAGTEAIKKIMSLSEMKDAAAGLNFHGTGKLCTPLGAKLIHVPTMAAGKIIGLDKNCALEMVQAGDVITEYDKLIDRQLERAAVTSIAGFAKIYKDAAKGITLPSAT